MFQTAHYSHLYELKKNKQQHTPKQTCGVQNKKIEGRGSHFSGGVIVMVWAVNSSSKYLVSVSDVT